MEIILDGLRETFRDLVGTTIKEQGIDISLFAEEYLVDILCSFFSGSDAVIKPVYLVDLLRTALDSDGWVREEYLRITGDIALFKTGIFPDSCESAKSAFTFGDCIDIGRAAYNSIDSEMFDELALKFPTAVEALNVVSFKIDLSSNDLVKYMKRRRYLNVCIAKG